MPTDTAPTAATGPAPFADRHRARPRHRPLRTDQVVITVIAAAGCLLSFDALRQMALAAHIRPALTYLFPVVIDGFIGYGVRAIVVLRDAPWHTRAYVWTLFSAATAASLWANALHAIRLNQTGTHILSLNDHTVAILSAIAPLALGGATHLYIVVSRYGGKSQPATPSTAAATAGSPSMVPAAEPVIPAEELPIPQPTAHGPLPTAPADANPGAAESTPPSVLDTTDSEHQQGADRVAGAGQEGNGDSGQPSQAARGGRRAEASIEQLAEIIKQAHPGTGQITRAMARSAIEAHGLSAGNDRITEALKQLQPDDVLRPHPAAD